MSILDSYNWLKIMCSVRGDCGNCGESSHNKCCGLLLKDEQGTCKEELGMHVHTCTYAYVTNLKNVALGWRRLDLVSSCVGGLVTNAAMLRL